MPVQSSDPPRLVCIAIDTAVVAQHELCRMRTSAAMRRMLAPEDAKAELTNQILADGHAVVEGFVVGRQLLDFAGISARGQAVRIPVCVSYDVVDGAPARGRVYLGTGVLAADADSG